LTNTERISIAFILKHLLRKIGDLHLPYNFYFHQVIPDKDQHWYLKVTPRGSVWAGVELRSGLINNPVSPADAAANDPQGLSASRKSGKTATFYFFPTYQPPASEPLKIRDNFFSRLPIRTLKFSACYAL